MHPLATSFYLSQLGLIQFGVFLTSLYDCVAAVLQIMSQIACSDGGGAVELSFAEWTHSAWRAVVLQFSQSFLKEDRSVVSARILRLLALHQRQLILNSFLLSKKISYCVPFHFQRENQVVQTCELVAFLSSHNKFLVFIFSTLLFLSLSFLLSSFNQLQLFLFATCLCLSFPLNLFTLSLPLCLTYFNFFGISFF